MTAPSHVIPEPPLYRDVIGRHPCLWNLHDNCTPTHIPRKKGLICRECWTQRCEAHKERDDGASWCSTFFCFEPTEDTICRKCTRRPSRSRSPLQARRTASSYRENRQPASVAQTSTQRPQTSPQQIDWQSMNTRDLLRHLDAGIGELRRRDFWVIMEVRPVQFCVNSLFLSIAVGL